MIQPRLKVIAYFRRSVSAGIARGSGIPPACHRNPALIQVKFFSPGSKWSEGRPHERRWLLHPGLDESD